VTKHLPKIRTNELEDNVKLLRQWHAFHAEQLQEILAGPDGTVLTPVIEQLKTLGPGRSQALIELVQRCDWSTIGADTKLVLLHELNAAIGRVRRTLKLEPIDDPLPGQPENLYRIIKMILEIPAPKETNQ
jgi:hypothetical protein